MFSFIGKGVEIMDQKKITEFYSPTDQDYQYWTEENNQKKILETTSISMEKDYSHNFFLFRKDHFGFLTNRENNFNIELIQKNLTKSLNHNSDHNNNFFNDIFFSPEKIRYFDVKTPTSEIFYSVNFLQENALGVLFTQSPNKKMNYSIEYRNRIRNHHGNEQEPNFEKQLFLTTFVYQDQKSSHFQKLWGHYLYQNFSSEKKRKKPIWETTNNNIFFEKQNFFYERFYINIIQKIFPFLSWLDNYQPILKNHIEYTKYFKKHFLSKEVIQNNMINYYHLKNECSLIFGREEKERYNVEIGVIYDRIRYQLFLLNNLLNKKIYKKKKDLNVISIKGKIDHIINKIFEFHSNGKWMVNIENNHFKNYLQANTQLNTLLFSKFHFLTQLSIENTNIFPDIIHFSFFQKNKECDNNNKYYYDTMNGFYTKKSIIFFFFPKKEENFDISLKISKMNNSSNKEKVPNFLHWKYINSCEFKIGTIHNIWKFQFNNVFLYQKYNSDQLIFSIPNFISRNTISYKDSYFDKSLFIQTGISIHYFNKFYHQDFSSYPFDLFSFYSGENECYPKKIVRKIPLLDYFLNFKIFRVIFYASIQDLQNLIISDPIIITNTNEKTNDDNNRNRDSVRIRKRKIKKYFSIKVGLLWNLFT
ncbi:putative porin [Blattabacterium cuenoti]|uniref:putative porin n=1 Tax=Blattabacterium cuenoti TaxID=1653831 RepID=UPI00163C232B|nr:putative porin [Blattabacterium cuenoti]